MTILSAGSTVPGLVTITANHAVVATPFAINSLVQDKSGQLFRIRGFAAFDHPVNRAQAQAVAYGATKNPPDISTFVRFTNEVRTVTSEKDPWLTTSPANPMDAATLARRVALAANRALTDAQVRAANLSPFTPTLAGSPSVPPPEEFNSIVWGS